MLGTWVGETDGAKVFGYDCAASFSRVLSDNRILGAQYRNHHYQSHPSGLAGTISNTKIFTQVPPDTKIGVVCPLLPIQHPALGDVTIDDGQISYDIHPGTLFLSPELHKKHPGITLNSTRPVFVRIVLRPGQY